MNPSCRWANNAGKPWRGNRPPTASVNFVTAHDGFTLSDLVAYNSKHNDANGEQGADGESHNLSWNCGEEGDSERWDVNVSDGSMAVVVGRTVPDVCRWQIVGHSSLPTMVGSSVLMRLHLCLLGGISQSHPV